MEKQKGRVKMSGEKRKGFLIGGLFGGGVAAVTLLVLFAVVCAPLLSIHAFLDKNSVSGDNCEVDPPKTVSIDGVRMDDTQLEQYKGPFDDIVEPYFKQQLNFEETVLYNAIKYAVENGMQEIRFEWVMPEEQIRKISGFVRCDWPSLPTYGYDEVAVPSVFDSYYGTTIVLGSQAASEKYRDQLLMDTVEEIAGLLPQGLEDDEIAKFFYDYLVEHVQYDYGFSQSNNWLLKSAYGALVNGKADYDGFANALSLLCNFADIQCFKVYADWDDPLYVGAWNVVALREEEYYFADAASDAIAAGVYTSEKRYAFDGAFCQSEDTVSISKDIWYYTPEISGIREKEMFDLVVEEEETPGEDIYAETDAVIGKMGAALKKRVSEGTDYIQVKIKDSDFYYSLSRGMMFYDDATVPDAAGLGGAASYWYDDRYQTIYYVYERGGQGTA